MGGTGWGPEKKTSSKRCKEDGEQSERGLKLSKDRAADRRQSPHGCVRPPWLEWWEQQVGSEGHSLGSSSAASSPGAWACVQSDGGVSLLIWKMHYAKQKAIYLDFSFNLKGEEKQ